MNFNEIGILQKQKVKIISLLPEIGIEQAREEIISGLLSKNPHISSKYFYDSAGSELFERITELEEYYPTRTEKEILKSVASEIMNRNEAFEIIELGSGDCSKISILLDAVKKSNLQKVKYIPVDFSSSAVEKSAYELSERFPELQINGYVADFFQQLNQIPHSDKPRLVCFLGSTIGNFTKVESQKIIKNLAKGIIKGDSLLIGFDLIKSENILNAAYNDSEGVTKKFNYNILNVVNGIIDSDFKIENFDHFSKYIPERSRVEMHLIANKNCEVNSPFANQTLRFEKGESIHTENSHKFSDASIHELIQNSELKIKNTYTDAKNLFALVEFRK